MQQQPAVVLTVYRALSRALRKLQPQIERHGRSAAILFTEVRVCVVRSPRTRSLDAAPLVFPPKP